MAGPFRSRLKKALNAFLNKEDDFKVVYGDTSYSYRPDRPRLSRGNDRTIVAAIFNRIALDVSSSEIRHVTLDQNGRYVEEVDSYLNQCLTIEANMDQSARAFLQDVVLSMFDEGVVAIVPIDVWIEEDEDKMNKAPDIMSMRTGKIIEWYPSHIKVNVYNEMTGKREDLIVPKRSVAIVENPLYSVINEPNSMVQRLIRKLSLLDQVDEKTSSGKLDLIIQLPYIVKTPARGGR